LKVAGFERFEKEISAAGPGARFLVGGPEPWQAMRLRALVRDRFEKLGFEYVSYSGDDLSAGDLSRAFSEGSLFASGRLVRIADAEKASQACRRELIGLAGDSCDSALLVEVADQRSALAGRLEKTCLTFVCWDPFERDMQKWCARLVSESGLSLAPDTGQLFVEYASGSLVRLADAVGRAALYAKGGRLGRREAAGLLWASADADAFSLADSALSGDWRGALGKCWALVSAGEEPVGLLALLFRQWLRAEEAREAIRAGGGEAAVERVAGGRGPAARRLMEAASKGSWGRPWDMAECFASADTALKTGSDPFVTLAGVVRSLTGR